MTDTRATDGDKLDPDTAAGEIPRRLPDADTSMIIGYELRELSGAATNVVLQAAHEGWSASRSDSQGSKPVSDEVTIQGRTIAVMLKDAGLLRASGMVWKVETSWTSSPGSRGGTAQYAFDAAPSP